MIQLKLFCKYQIFILCCWLSSLEMLLFERSAAVNNGIARQCPDVSEIESEQMLVFLPKSRLVLLAVTAGQTRLTLSDSIRLEQFR